MLYIALLIVTIIAFVISAISGGGASLILIPLLDLMLPSAFVPFALTVGTFSSSTSRVIVFRKHIDWRIFRWFVPFSIPFVVLGAFLLRSLNPMYLQLIVALFLIGNIPMLLRKKGQERKDEKPHSVFILALVGALAGFISGVTGAVGLLFNRFYLKYGLSKEQIVATRAANEIILHLIKLVVYIAVGLFSVEALMIGGVVAIAAFISAYVAKRLLPFLSERVFRKIGYGAMVLAGLFLMTKTVNRIIQEDGISMQTLVLKEKKETKIFWRESYVKLEYSWNHGLELEVPIDYSGLPLNVQQFHDSIAGECDDMLIERVYGINTDEKYEIYCFSELIYKKYNF
jgi:uncharacterized protein